MTHKVQELQVRVKQVAKKVHVYFCHQPEPGGFGELDMWMTTAEYRCFRQFMAKYLSDSRKLAEATFAFGTKEKPA